MGKYSQVMLEPCTDPSFIEKMTLVGVSVRVGTDEPEALVEGSSSGQLFLDGGPSSSSASEISSNRSSTNSHRPEVLQPTREAAKQPQASFSSWAALALSVAAHCSMSKD